MNSSVQTPPETTPAQEGRAAKIWGGMVCGLLGACLVSQFSFLYIASSDPSVVAEPDYYAKAINWEDRQRQERINAELGWRGDVELGPAESGTRRVRLRLETAEGTPVDCRLVRVELFHKARAARAFRGTLARTETPGVYEASLPLRRSGLWELRLEAWQGEARWTLRRDLNTPES
jgi:nitrogen fixation protein FixH